jgi:hypothetical protein
MENMTLIYLSSKNKYQFQQYFYSEEDIKKARQVPILRKQATTP